MKGYLERALIKGRGYAKMGVATLKYRCSRVLHILIGRSLKQ